MTTTAKPRPYWHVDAKWLTAMLLGLALMLTLPLLALHQVTSASNGPKLIAYVLAGLVSPQGLDSEEGLAEVKAQVRQAGQHTLNFGGVPVTITASDVDQLSARELRLKVVGGFADKLYHQGPRQLAQQSGAAQAEIDKAEADAALLRPLTKEGHDVLSRALLVLGLIDAALLALVVFFSYRAGRLVSPGIVMVLAGLPGLVFAGIASRPQQPVVTARSAEPDGPTGQIGAFVGFVVPLVIDTFARVYLIVLGLGIALLVAAAVWRVVLHVRRPKNS